MRKASSAPFDVDPNGPGVPRPPIEDPPPDMPDEPMPVPPEPGAPPEPIDLR